ncbi:hypothetical protein HZC53_05860 [Candidatus Uhrbacteria bacterium]|nr:hypothetical protein [Candidatus Uhrbacteria bacterium]
MPASNLFNRILLILGALAVAGSVFWFLYTSLTPVEVPPPPASRGALHFDVRADLSKNQRFMQLRPLVSDFNVVPGAMGRQNPFMPLPPPLPVSPSSTTSTKETVATSTVMTATSTSPQMAVTSTDAGEQ